ncbi:MAG TPA: hypothetical protein VGE07_27145 [Herpetosiphonaceae bacterium]
MKQAWRWWPWMTVGLGLYAAWDIVDQTVLLPRAPLLGGYALDWAVAGLAGAVAATLLARRQRRAPVPSPLAEAAQSRAAAVSAHISALNEALGETLGEISSEAGAAMEVQGDDQQRALRRVILAVHRAQSLCDELAGMSASPRFAAPPPSQEMRPSNLSSWEESPG